MKAASSSGSLAIVAGFFKRGTGPTPATIFQVSLVRFQYLSLVATIDELGRLHSRGVLAHLWCLLPLAYQFKRRDGNESVLCLFGVQTVADDSPENATCLFSRISNFLPLRRRATTCLVRVPNICLLVRLVHLLANDRLNQLQVVLKKVLLAHEGYVAVYFQQGRARK